MATYTPNYNLVKPDYEEPADIAQLNNNADLIDAALAGKQDTLTFDSTPTSGSTNPVTSGGVYTGLDGKQDKLTLPLDIAQGGTGANSANDALVNLGIGGVTSNNITYTSLADLIAYIQSLSGAPKIIARVQASALSTLTGGTTSSNGIAIIYKPSVNNSYYFAFNRDVAGYGNINHSSGTANVAHPVVDGDTIGIVATGTTAPQAITAGQYVIWQGSLYTAKSNIASGATLSTSNLTAVSGGGLNSLLGSLNALSNNVGNDAILYQASATTHTFTVPSNSRNLVIASCDGVTRMWAGLVYGANGGNVTTAALYDGENITMSVPGTNQIQFTLSSSNSMYLRCVNIRGTALS